MACTLLVWPRNRRRLSNGDVLRRVQGYQIASCSSSCPSPDFHSIPFYLFYLIKLLTNDHRRDVCDDVLRDGPVCAQSWHTLIRSFFFVLAVHRPIHDPLHHTARSRDKAGQHPQLGFALPTQLVLLLLSYPSEMISLLTCRRCS